MAETKEYLVNDLKALPAAALIHRARAVIFDCDDTILATIGSRWKLLISTAQTFGVALTKETIKKAWGIPFDELIRTLVPTLETDEFLLHYRKAMSEHQPETTIGAVELVSALAARGITMEILSSSSYEVILQDLDALNLTGYFTAIYCQEQTRFHKPDPRVLEDILDSLNNRGFDESEMVYVGDSVRDHRVALGNNLEFVAVLSGLETASDFIAAGVSEHRIVNNLAELLPA